MFLMTHDLIGLRLTLGLKIGCWYYSRQYLLADQFNKTCFQWGFWGRGESVELPKMRHYKILYWFGLRVPEIPFSWTSVLKIIQRRDARGYPCRRLPLVACISTPLSEITNSITVSLLIFNLVITNLSTNNGGKLLFSAFGVSLFFLQQ